MSADTGPGKTRKRNATSWTSATAPRVGGKKGRKFARTILRENAALIAAGTGMDPKQFMLHCISDDTLPMEMRQTAARDVIAYIHKKMPQAVELYAHVRLNTGFAQAVAAFAAGDEAPAPAPLAPAAPQEDEA